MAATQQRTFSLSAEQASFIDAQVETGAYANASEVVSAGIEALRERDNRVEAWLREEVAATYDEMHRADGGGNSPEQVADILHAHHESRNRSA